MGKNKHSHNRPGPPAPAVRREPTAEQHNRVDAATSKKDELTAEHGSATTDGVSEPVGRTLEESLKRVERLLVEARAHYENARSRQDANEKERKRLDEQKRAQEDTERYQDQLFQDHQEREHDAKRRFEKESARLDDERAQLRQERNRLDDELAERRARAEAEWDAKDQARALRWADEDKRQAERRVEANRRLEEEITRQRSQALEALCVVLADERQRGEGERDERDRKLTVKQKALHVWELDLLAARELHDEDRAGLDRKVERLVAERTETQRHEADALKNQLHDARNDRDRYWRDLESRKELDRRFGDRSPEDILAALTSAERDRDTLAQQLRERPDSRVTEQLAQLEHERSAWLDDRAVLLADLAKAHGELATRRLDAIELEALRKQKEALEVHKQLLGGAVDELRGRVEALTGQEQNLNPMKALTDLDEKPELQEAVATTKPLSPATPTLKEFAIDLRHRIARGVEGRTLYYADRDVRAFLGGLAMTRLMLLQGISGTGKTSLPKAFASAVSGGLQIVPVQAGWRDRQDLVGYYNAFHRHYYATDFLQALYMAGTPAYRDRLFMMVLDEINLSRPEQFFADFLSELERPTKERRLTLLTDALASPPRLMVEGRHLKIPPNVWFIGTANHDETTTEFADKTYDRAHVMEMTERAAHDTVEAKDDRNPISFARLEDAFNDAADRRAADVRKATDWLRTESFVKDLRQRFRVGWGHRLEHQIARYLPVVVESGGTPGEAMDHLLVTKVLRKLRDRHDVRVDALEDLRTKLQNAWATLCGDSLPDRCDELIAKEIAAKKGEDLA